MHVGPCYANQMRADQAGVLVSPFPQHVCSYHGSTSYVHPMRITDESNLVATDRFLDVTSCICGGGVCAGLTQSRQAASQLWRR